MTATRTAKKSNAKPARKDGERRLNPALAAAVIGGAAAASAGAFLTARALARRNGAANAGELNAVMANACTAEEMSRGQDAEVPRDAVLA